MHTFHKTLAIAVGISISSPAYSTEIVFDQQLAADYCTKRYSKRGVLDEGLFNYCMDRQTNGDLDALYLQEKYSNIEKVEQIDEVVAWALNRWLEPREYMMHMVAREIEKQGEAYLNIAYEVSAGNVSSEQLEDCKAKHFPRWGWVEQCLED